MSDDLGFPTDDARRLVSVALEEDLGPRSLDVTTVATIPADQDGAAVLVARACGVVAGLPAVELVYAAVAALTGAPAPVVEQVTEEGERVQRGDVLIRLHGPTRGLLTGERTALNLVSRLSGVATHTRRWADALEGSTAKVLDTRKTTPGMRALEKYAVRVGGGVNKRMGLYDVAMVKDNHKLAAGSVTAAYVAVRQRFPDVDIQVEVTTVAEAREAYAAGSRFLLCDNMPLPVLRDTVTALRALPEPVELEATGGLTLDVASEVARTGVDYLSVGALTHSSPILDIALDLTPSSLPLAGR